MENKNNHQKKKPLHFLFWFLLFGLFELSLAFALLTKANLSEKKT